MSIKKGIKTIRREVMRAMMERFQSEDLTRMYTLFGAADPVIYDDVEETLNIAYVNRAEDALAMDIFKPKTPEKTELPVIVMVHGGGLFSGDRGINRPYGRLLAHKGYLVFSLEYRLAPKATIFQQFDDVCAGMDLVGKMLVDEDVDFGRLFLVADSAGAYLGAYVASMHESEKLQRAVRYKASKMVFAAVGFICGMFYTNEILEEQIFGDRRDDAELRKFMNIEHPEIINNLPPAFLITSCGDTFNNYSFRFHNALKEAGRTSRLLYLGDEELLHVFPIMNPEHPRSLEATDKMLVWMEEQAEIRRQRRRKNPAVERARKKVEKRIADGSISSQKAWSNIRERIAFDPEKLRKTALVDCTREYSYEQLFQEWERYARAFSGLGIGAVNRSRVALCGAITAEPIFALYGLNMTGAEVSLFSYPDFLPNGMWKDMIEKEKITDLIVSDIMVTPEVWEEIIEVRKQFGLRHVILMHSLMGGPALGPAELVYNEFNYHMLRHRSDTVFMGDLLTQYAAEEIRYDKSTGDRIAIIAHTSGTTHGTRKMLPLTDKVVNDQLNAVPGGHRGFLKGKDDGKQLRMISLFDLSSVMGFSAQVNSVFAEGETAVTTFFGFMHPKFIRAVDYYNINFLIITGFMVDKWLDRSDLDGVDLSSLKAVGITGGYTSPEKLQKYSDFFKAHGYQHELINVYGSSESGLHVMNGPHGMSGGHGMPSPHGGADSRDSLGFASGPQDLRIRDENDGKFYRPEDGPRTGVLYAYTEARPSNTLDGEVQYEFTEIDGKEFLCMNDLVRVNEDGSLSFAGRADKYFVNNDGKKFDSGIVEKEMADHAAIDRCAVVPVFEKRIHDTVPVLYVVPARKGQHAAEDIRRAFVDVYVREKKIDAGNLPTQFMLVDDIPLNPNGKLDIFRITRERLGGAAYNLVPVQEGGELTDIRTEFVENINSMTAGTLPHGMENNSAYNVFDLFTGGPSKGHAGQEPEPSDGFPDFFSLWKKHKAALEKQAEKSPATILSEIPQSIVKPIIKYGNRLISIPNGRRWTDHDIED